MTKKSKEQRKQTRDGILILRSRVLKNDPERLERVADYREELEIAEQIYMLRTQAGLTQEQLAERVGTKGSVISRLEDAEYEGHSLSMLRRIASVLDMRVVVSFVPLEKTGS